MAPRNGVRLRMPLPLKDMKLGDVVLDIENPLNDRRSYPLQLLDEDISLIDEQELRDFQARTGQTEVLAQFAQFLQAAGQGTELDASQVQTGIARLYRLINSGDKFKTMKDTESLKEWLDEHCAKAGLPAYMIVGLWTYTDAQAALIQQGGALGNIRGGGGGATAGGGASRNTLAMRMSRVVGENVFALEYRKVSLKWYSKAIDKAKLQQGVQEQKFWGMRGEGDVESEDYELKLTDEPDEEVDDPDYLFQVDAMDD